MISDGGVDETGTYEITLNCLFGNCPKSTGSVTASTGDVQVNFQGALAPVTSGFILRQGMELRTGGGAAVEGACGDGGSFSLGANANLFLDGPPCPSAPAGPTLAAALPSFLDLTQGEFKFTATGVQAQKPIVRSPISRTEIGEGGRTSRPCTPWDRRSRWSAAAVSGSPTR